MTTVILTKEYLAADRLVSMNEMAYSDSKIRIINDRLAYFLGPTHITADDRDKMEKHLFRFVLGKDRNNKSRDWLTTFIESNTILVLTKDRALEINALQRLQHYSTETGLQYTHPGLNVSEHTLETPLTFGTGADLAKVGWACGQSPQNIILTVQSIDPFSGHGADVIYREDLK